MRVPKKTDYTAEEILKLFNSLIGDIDPFGNTTFDYDVVIPNVVVLGEVVCDLVLKLAEIEDNYGNQLISLNEVGKKAKKYMDIIREMGAIEDVN